MMSSGEQQDTYMALISNHLQQRCIAQLLAILAFITLSLPAFAFTFSIQLVDPEGEPIAGNVTIDDGSPIDVSLTGGQAEVNHGGPHRLHLRASGFYDSVHTLNPTSGNLTFTLVAKKDGRRMFTFAGDTMAGRRYIKPRAGEPELLSNPPKTRELNALLAAMTPYLQLADVTSLNLETQLFAKPPKSKLGKSITFYTHPRIANALKASGVDYVALGNNHSYDFAEAGLIETLDHLNDADLGHSGAGVNATEAHQPWLWEDYAFFSYVGWPGTFKPNQVASANKGGAALGTAAAMARDVLRVNAHTVINYHSGLEYAHTPAQMDRTRMRHAIDAGADVVVGHHPHVMQGLELYKNRLIAYSLGNFLFDQYIYSTQATFLLHVWMDNGEFYGAEIVPVNVLGYKPTPATGYFADSILAQMRGLSSANLSFSASGRHAWVSHRKLQTGRSIALQELDPGVPVRLSTIGVNWSEEPDVSAPPNERFRLGRDLLRRGDLSDLAADGSGDRSWLESERIVAVSGQHLQVTGSAITGLKVFDRVFTPANPQTLSLSLNAPIGTKIEGHLHRRLPDDSLSKGLTNSATIKIGEHTLEESGAQTITWDFNSPRLPTKGLRFLLKIKQPDNAVATIDDIVWIEWLTPWLSAGEAHAARGSTFIQRSPKLHR